MHEQAAASLLPARRRKALVDVVVAVESIPARFAGAGIGVEVVCAPHRIVQARVRLAFVAFDFAVLADPALNATAVVVRDVVVTRGAVPAGVGGTLVDVDAGNQN